MPVAVNKKTGEAVYLEDGEWKPARIAENKRTGERVAFDGKEWVPVGGAKEGLFASGSALEAIHDATTGVGAGIPFSDEILAGAAAPFRAGYRALTGGDEGKGLGERLGGAYDTELEQQRRIQDTASARSPIATGIGEVAGGVALGGTLAKGGGTLLNVAKPTYGSMIARGAGEGALYGGTYGFAAGEGVDDRLARGAGGVAIGGLAGGALGAAGARSASKAASRATPQSGDLEALGTQAYQAAEAAGLKVAPASIGKIAKDMRSAIVSEGYGPRTLDRAYPQIRAVLDDFDELASRPLSLSELDNQRKLIGRLAGSPDKTQRFLASKLKDKLDDWMSGLSSDDVLSGDPANALSALTQARRFWHMKSKAEKIESLFERALNKVGANYTAAGYQTAIRQEFKSLLNNEKAIRGFTKAERKAIEKVVRGAPVENLLRQLGKFAPRGVVGTVLSGVAGNALGGPVGMAALMGTGEAARRASSALGARNAGIVSELIRSGGERPLAPLSPVKRALLEGTLFGGAALTP